LVSPAGNRQQDSKKQGRSMFRPTSVKIHHETPYSHQHSGCRIITSQPVMKKKPND
jgi:hypothetical protein